MKAKRDNKGFSLVELIIVIAIMAVLIGVMAPQYLRYVNNARVNTDITNASEIAKVIDAAHAKSYGDPVDEIISGAGGTSISNVSELSVLPVSKVNGAYIWEIHSTKGSGVSQITLNGYVIYPYSEAPGTFYGEYHQ